MTERERSTEPTRRGRLPTIEPKDTIIIDTYP